MIEGIKLAVMGWLEHVHATITVGGDLEEELARATADIEALCEGTDRLYRDAACSMR